MQKFIFRTACGVAAGVVISACAGARAGSSGSADVAGSAAAAGAGKQQIDAVDLHHLPLGDGHLSTAPRIGYIWACRTDQNAGGAFRDGPWIHADGTYDLTAKAEVDGNIMWNRRFEITRHDSVRVFSLNDLPSHGTGVFPIAQNDDAFQYDRNPNRIREQSVSVTLAADPVQSAQPTCAPGAVGILLSGAVLFNALDAPGRDAVAHETQDHCQGHPQMSGMYHYHSVTTCGDDKRTAGGHSALVGYALDGFGIYGRYGEGGKLLHTSDLDACHGHSHRIAWDGKDVVMYHYHATWEFPYTVGCMRGAYRMSDVMQISGGPPRGRGGPPGKN